MQTITKFRVFDAQLNELDDETTKFLYKRFSWTDVDTKLDSTAKLVVTNFLGTLVDPNIRFVEATVTLHAEDHEVLVTETTAWEVFEGRSRYGQPTCSLRRVL